MDWLGTRQLKIWAPLPRSCVINSSCQITQSYSPIHKSRSGWFPKHLALFIGNWIITCGQAGSSAFPLRFMKRWQSSRLRFYCLTSLPLRIKYIKIGISCTTRSLVILFAVPGNMGAEICVFLDSIVDQATTVTIRQPRNDITNLSFVTPVEKFRSTTATNQKSLLLKLVRTKNGFAAMQKDRLTSNLGNKLTPSQNWELIMELLTVERKKSIAELMKMLHKTNYFWSSCLETIKGTHHIVNQKEENCFFRQQLYQKRDLSWEMLCKHIEKQQKAGVIEPVQYNWANYVVLVSTRNVIFRIFVECWLFNAASVPDTYLLLQSDDFINSLRTLKCLQYWTLNDSIFMC